MENITAEMITSHGYFGGLEWTAAIQTADCDVIPIRVTTDAARSGVKSRGMIADDGNATLEESYCAMRTSADIIL